MSDEGTTTTTGDEGTATEQEQQATEQEQKAPEQAQQESPEQTIARLQRELSSARGEASKGRVNAKEKAAQEREQQVVSNILKALGLNKDGEKEVSVDDLTTQLSAAQRETKQLRMREAVRAAAARDKTVDPDRILRDAEFLRALDALEPGDDDGLKKAIRATLEVAPWLAVQETAPKRSGNDTSGGTGESQLTKDQFKQMSGAERNELFNKNPDLYRSLRS